jgi:TonB family protein
VLSVSTLAVRLAAVGVSAGAHVAVLFTSLGHPAGPGKAADATLEIDVTTVQEAVEAIPEPEVARPPGGAHWHTHTHPYPVPASHDWTPHDPNLVHTFAPPAVGPSPAVEEEPHDHDHDHDDMPRFTIALGPGRAGGGEASGAAEEGAGAPVPQDKGAPLAESAVDGRARLTRGVQPTYPAEARAAGFQGSVALELVVAASGAVESARVVGPVGHGLDEAALAAARQFRFAPATKGGHAVPVRMAWSVEFRLRD